MNPTYGILIKRPVRYFRHKFCPVDVVNLLIDSAKDDSMKFILLCGFDAGMRRNEISEAVPAWFSTPGVINLQNSPDHELKDGDARCVPMTKRFIEFIARYGKPEPFMLKPEVLRKTSRYRYDFRRPFNEHVAAVGKANNMDLSYVTIHTMRYTFASLRIEAGRSLDKVALWLGDGVDVVRRHYGYLSPKIDKDIEL